VVAGLATALATAFLAMYLKKRPTSSESEQSIMSGTLLRQVDVSA
jgi:hypothetical protein